MKGQTIVEVVVALGIGIIILSAMTVIVITSLNNSKQGATVGGATQSAQEGMEIIRNMRDNNWSAFSALSGNYCLAATCTTVNSQGTSCGPKGATCGLNHGFYSRELSVSQNDISCRPSSPVSGSTYNKVTLTVAWTDSKCASSSTYCHNIKLDSCLSNFGVRTGL